MGWGCYRYSAWLRGVGFFTDRLAGQADRVFEVTVRGFGIGGGSWLLSCRRERTFVDTGDSVDLRWTDGASFLSVGVVGVEDLDWTIAAGWLGEVGVLVAGVVVDLPGFELG